MPLNKETKPNQTKLILNSNTWKHLTVWKQIIDTKAYYYFNIALL